MFVDSREVPPGKLFEHDICIIGAGAAGITLARALSASHRSVCVVESGGFEPEGDVQFLYMGKAEGPALAPNGYLRTSRLRYFGGTTNHWTGFCRPLDALDFQPRSWIADSGWPIGPGDLAPYYDRAAEVLRIKPFVNGGDTAHTEGATIPPSDAFVAKQFQYSQVRFAEVYRSELRDASTVTVLLHANVVDLEVDESGSLVTRVHVATMRGKRFTVAARLVVVATGGVENARLLLSSNTVHRTGLGNRTDRVGRFFMEHPVVMGALVCLTDPGAALRLNELGGFLNVSPAAQRSEELLNVCVDLNPRLADASLDESQAGGRPLDLRDLFYRTADLGGGSIPSGSGHDYRFRRCFLYCEPGPYADSRVTLDDEVDALGMRQTRLIWKTTTLETRSLQRTKQLLALALGTRRIGRMLVDTEDGASEQLLGATPWTSLLAANHHMGTTRMSAAPADGVVNPDCQVHDVSNLYVAGSSVFPTAGFANPTFTIVALALRLADHLEARLVH